MPLNYTIYHSALYFAITADQSNQTGRLKQLYDILQRPWNYPVMDYKVGLSEVNEYDEKIRNTQSYRNCLRNEYDEIIKLFWIKIHALGYE